MKTCVVYIRFNQKQEDFIIDTHKSLIKESMEKQGYKVEKYFIDNGYTGTNFNRPAYQEMMEYLRNNKINAVAVKDITRISRNILDFAEFANEMQRLNVDVFLLDELRIIKNYF